MPMRKREKVQEMLPLASSIGVPSSNNTLEVTFDPLRTYAAKINVARVFMTKRV